MKEGLRKALLAELGLGGEGVNPEESGGGGIPGYQSVASNPSQGPSARPRPACLRGSSSTTSSRTVIDDY